jgi:hypothetical protein
MDVVLLQLEALFLGRATTVAQLKAAEHGHDSTGTGDEGEIDTRGPWNEGGDWKFISSPALQDTQFDDLSLGIKTESSPPTAPDGLDELLVDELRDILHAEKRLIEALPKMAKAARFDWLRELFELHLQQVDRINECFSLLGASRFDQTVRPSTTVTIHHCVSIFAYTILRQHVVIGNAFFRENRPNSQIFAIMIRRASLSEARTLVDPEDAGYTANDAADHATNNRPDRTSRPFTSRAPRSTPPGTPWAWLGTQTPPDPAAVSMMSDATLFRVT